jgi:OOP family OmpA-OmpF porin
MTLNSRIIERAINASMIVFLFVVTGIYSCLAQGLAPIKHPGYQPARQVVMADKNIRLAPNANLEGMAVPLHAAINSPFSELKPVLAPGGNRLYFSRSEHPNNTFGETDMEDIWYSDRDRASNTWSEPIRMEGILNNQGPNYINNVGITGDTIVLGNQYGRKGKMRAGLSYSVNVRGQWSAPTPIYIQNDYNISAHASAFVSLKNGVIIQAVQRVETLGERDLYVSFWDGINATEPINMGGVINTELEESSPYLDADNKTLYFVSKGHQGYGGYDIFVTKRLDESWTNWSEPQNLGPAVNGAMDDESFSISPCGKYAIFSKQVNVHNIDLFKISTEELFGQPIKNYKKSEDNQALSAL